jgi:hypothetical protein
MSYPDSLDFLSLYWRHESSPQLLHLSASIANSAKPQTPGAPRLSDLIIYYSITLTLAHAEHIAYYIIIYYYIIV